MVKQASKKIKLRLYVVGEKDGQFRMCPILDNFFIPIPAGETLKDFRNFALTIEIDTKSLTVEKFWDIEHTPLTTKIQKL
jgi:hypothetical protein